jgi:hypothetical protein
LKSRKNKDNKFISDSIISNLDKLKIHHKNGVRKYDTYAKKHAEHMLGVLYASESKTSSDFKTLYSLMVFVMNRLNEISNTINKLHEKPGFGRVRTVIKRETKKEQDVIDSMIESLDKGYMEEEETLHE